MYLSFSIKNSKIWSLDDMTIFKFVIRNSKTHVTFGYDSIMEPLSDK